MLIFTTNNRGLRVSLWTMTLRNTAILPLYTQNFTTGMNAPLSDISYHRAEEAGPWTSLLSLHNDRSWIWTACRSAVLPVGGLQRPCRNCLLSSFLRQEHTSPTVGRLKCLERLGRGQEYICLVCSTVWEAFGAVQTLSAPTEHA